MRVTNKEYEKKKMTHNQDHDETFRVLVCCSLPKFFERQNAFYSPMMCLFFLQQKFPFLSCGPRHDEMTVVFRFAEENVFFFSFLSPSLFFVCGTVIFCEHSLLHLFFTFTPLPSTVLVAVVKNDL